MKYLIGLIDSLAKLLNKPLHYIIIGQFLGGGLIVAILLYVIKIQGRDKDDLKGELRESKKRNGVLEIRLERKDDFLVNFLTGLNAKTDSLLMEARAELKAREK